MNRHIASAFALVNVVFFVAAIVVGAALVIQPEFVFGLVGRLAGRVDPTALRVLGIVVVVFAALFVFGVFAVLLDLRSTTHRLVALQARQCEMLEALIDESNQPQPAQPAPPPQPQMPPRYPAPGYPPQGRTPPPPPQFNPQR